MGGFPVDATLNKKEETPVPRHKAIRDLNLFLIVDRPTESGNKWGLDPIKWLQCILYIQYNDRDI